MKVIHFQEKGKSLKKLSLIAFVLPFVVGCEAFVGLLDAEDSVARAAGKYKASTPTGTKCYGNEIKISWMKLLMKSS